MEGFLGTALCFVLVPFLFIALIVFIVRSNMKSGRRGSRGGFSHGSSASHYHYGDASSSDSGSSDSGSFWGGGGDSGGSSWGGGGDSGGSSSSSS